MKPKVGAVTGLPLLPHDQDRYGAEMIEILYDGNRLVIESYERLGGFAADLDHDHVSACLWAAQRAAERLDQALRALR